MNSPAICRATIVLAALSACTSNSSNELETQAIQETFSNVKDVAQIQDTKGSTATNYWYADGTFTNEWRNANDSGTVSGTWYAKDNQRCVVIVEGMESIKGQTRCGPIILEGNVFKSFNADGSVHAVHTLTKIP